MFEPGYDLNSAGSLSLTNGGQMILHQNCAFVAVTIEGVALTNGTYSYASLAGTFPHNFAAGGAGFGYRCNPYGMLLPPPAQLPQFLSQPFSQTNFTGMTVQMPASVYGYPAPSFQWQRGPAGSGSYSNLLSGGRFSGATAAALTITGLTLADAGNYILVASNSVGSVTSTPALLSVQAGPPMITSPAGLAVSLGSGGTYTITSSVPAWTFSGSVTQIPSQCGDQYRHGRDRRVFGIGFQCYSASVAHSAGIRLYTNQPVVVFSDTTLSASANDLAFPHLATYPANLDHESVRPTVDFSPYTFSQLVSESPWISLRHQLQLFHFLA